MNFLNLDFFLRPHHLAADLQPVLESVRSAWQTVAKQHCCPLCKTVPAVVVDGKWNMQCLICNDRGSAYKWNRGLHAGILTGCTARPLRGSKYCAAHQPPAGPVEQVTITAHREICEGEAILLQYEVGNRVWQRAAAVPMGAIRTYEMDLLPLREPLLKQPDACGADPRRGTPEASIGRKSAGILAAVSPCVRVVAIQPMYATESQGQVVSFLDDILQMLPRTAWVIYDFACGIRRHICAQLSLRRSKPEASRWQALDALTWAVDKMHFKTHKGCRNPHIAPYPDVSAATQYPYVTHTRLIF